jgi:hypothetical protein
MKAKKRRFRPNRKNLERRLTSYSLASGALLATGAVAQADVIVWNSGQTTPVNGILYFDFLSGSSGGSIPNAQFNLSNSYSVQKGTIRTFTGTTYTTYGGTTHNTNSNFYRRQRSQAYGSRNQTGAYFRGNGQLSKIYSGSDIGSGFFTANGRLGRHRSYTGGTGYNYDYYSGPWLRNDNGYLGVRFNDGSGTHYGWAEISVDSNYGITLQRFAYETQPDTSIEAGQTQDPLEILSVVSRKFHNGQPHDIPLPLTGDPGIECRQPGADGLRRSRPHGSSFGRHTLIVKFTNAMVSGDAVITGGTANVDSIFFPGNDTMEIELGAVENAQRLTIKLSSVTDHNGFVLDDTEVSMDVLLGDTTGNRLVNSSDVSETEAQSGPPTGVTDANCRLDVTVNGEINSSDVSAVQFQSGTGIPDPPPRGGRKKGRAIAPLNRARSQR